ncbi:hypothetical protein PRIPAC_92467, partial [Pristionchus pacificus]
FLSSFHVILTLLSSIFFTCHPIAPMSCPFDISSSSYDKQLIGIGIGLIVIGSCSSFFVSAAAALIVGGGILGYCIVHSFDIEDIGEKKVYCRCWKSEKFPFCDGSHNKHNKENGDNVGPLIIDKKQ